MDCIYPCRFRVSAARPVTTKSTRRLPHWPQTKPLVASPGNRHLGAVAFRHRGGVGLGLVLAIAAPNDQPYPRRGGVAERHRRAVVRFIAAISGLR
jgi:hypothetical protein